MTLPTRVFMQYDNTRRSLGACNHMMQLQKNVMSTFLEAGPSLDDLINLSMIRLRPKFIELLLAPLKILGSIRQGKLSSVLYQ